MWKSLDQNKFHLIIAFRSECALKGSYALQASLPLLASMKLYPSFKICLLMHMEEKERQKYFRLLIEPRAFCMPDFQLA